MPANRKSSFRIDAHVGAQLRQRRTEIAMSQKRLAKASGISFQQIRKYESALNRVSASRLYHFARLLRVPVAYFFEGLPSSAAGNVLAQADIPAAAVLRSAETARLIAAYYEVADPARRHAVFQLLRAMSAPPQ